MGSKFIFLVSPADVIWVEDNEAVAQRSDSDYIDHLLNRFHDRIRVPKEHNRTHNAYAPQFLIFYYH
jgi:hypothetical protein